jgi:AcrR family transcriptional regulator
MNDDELHRLLRQHPARVPLAASFDREVWSRIEAESTRTLGSLVAELFERTLAHFARPLTAAVTLAVFTLSGLGIGWSWHRHDMDERAALAYQQAINPLYRAGWEAGR